jgi:hypothetical protein
MKMFYYLIYSIKYVHTENGECVCRCLCEVL